MKRLLFITVFCIAVLFTLNAHAHAQDSTRTCSKWLDDYPKHVGLTWDAKMDITSNYLWRGFRNGGLSYQCSAGVGYGGAFVDMWWNIGATDWQFKKLKPELDLSIGFNRWGLKVWFVYVYLFDKDENGEFLPFFDFRNSYGLGSRPTAEVRVQYTVSSKLPLSVFVATRPCGRDGYYKDSAATELTKAWSTYIELGYDFVLPRDMTLSPRVAFTPWKSLYTRFEGDFALTNINLKLDKRWDVHQHVDVRAYVAFMANPWAIGYYQDLGQGLTANCIMFNAGFGISFK